MDGLKSKKKVYLCIRSYRLIGENITHLSGSSLSSYPIFPPFVYKSLPLEISVIKL
jgi:hypothetical protein